MPDDPIVRPLRPEDAPALRRLRLEALERCPTAFGASHAEALLLTEADFANSIRTAAPGAIFGAFDGRPIVGMAGLMVHCREKQSHKGLLWGVYVQPAFQGKGVGRRLVEAVICLARKKVLVLQAGVNSRNASAKGLYDHLGFRRFGVEPKAICVDGAYYDEDHLMLDFSPPAP